MVTLPAGWIETGISVSHSGSVTLQVAAAGAEFGGEPLIIEVGSDDIILGLEFTTFPTTLCANGWYTAVQVTPYTRRASEAFGLRVSEPSLAVAGACPQPYIPIPVSRSVTGLRLAATVDVNTTTGETRYRTRLWADDDTVDEVTVAGRTVTIDHSAGEFVDPSLQVRHVPVVWIAPPPAELANAVVVTGAAWNAESDPVTFDAYPMRGVILGGASGTVWTHTTKPPLHYAASARVEDAAGATPAGLVRIGNGAEFDLVANPGTVTVTRWRGSTTAVAGLLSGDWSADGVDLPSDERVVPLRRLKPKAPQNAPQDWTPGAFEITSPLSVLLSGSVFVGTGSVIVSGAGGLVWDVSGVASVSRSLSGAYDPSDDYMTTKHAVGDDVWGWGLFAYLEVDLTAPANGDLTLTLTWVAAGASPISADKTYTIPVTSGTHTYRVDLLFPNEGGPWYAERVDEISFSGFQSGSYQLHDLELLTVEQAYVKLHASGGATGLVIAQDGAYPIGWWDGNPLIGAGPEREKDDESGLFDSGGGPDTSAGGCIRMDGTLEDVMLEWDRMEGITATYDGSAIDADLTDGVNVCGTEDELVATPLTYTARWYHSQMALRAAANGTVGLDASLYLDGGADLCPAPAGTFVLPFRHVIGMVLEAQCKDSVTGLRAGAGAEVFARRSTSGAPTSSDPLLASGETDASGFASVAIRTGTVSGSEMYVALLDS